MTPYPKMLTIEAVRHVSTTATTPEGITEPATMKPGDRIDVIGAVRVENQNTQFVGVNLTEFTLHNGAFRIVYAR